MERLRCIAGYHLKFVPMVSYNKIWIDTDEPCDNKLTSGIPGGYRLVST